MIGKENGSLLERDTRQTEDQLVEANLPLVHSIVRRFHNRGYEYDDLFQLGCIGLLKAIRRFDPSFHVRFSTYAVPMIIGEIRRFLRDDGLLKVSRSLKDRSQALNGIRARLMSEWGREPTICELSREMGVEQEEISRILEAAAPVGSIDAEKENKDGSLSRLDSIFDERDIPESKIDQFVIREILQHLDLRDRRIIQLRYFAQKTQSETAREIGLSQVQISRMERAILGQLRCLLMGNITDNT